MLNKVKLASCIPAISLLHSFYKHAALPLVFAQGPLVVMARKGVPSLVPAPDASDVLFLTDFWHFTGNALAMRLNR
jgi:hypothetical protein